MPFGKWGSFTECVADMQGKADDPAALCAWLEHNLTGKWPAEASAYTSDQLVVLEAQATDALKTLHFQALPVKSLYGVEIFAAGTWKDSAGVERRWTHEQLAQMVAGFGQHSRVPLKVGHTSDRFNAEIAAALGVPVKLLTGEAGNGQVALGHVTKLALKGDKLVADFEGVPEPLATLIETGSFNAVSAEVEIGPDTPVLVGVALLGVEEPAVETLAGLAEARVFGKPKSRQSVYAFFSAKGGIVVNEETQMKALWETVKGFFARKKEEDMQLSKDTLVKEAKALFQGEDTLTAIAVALGLDPNTARLGDILMAIQTLKGGTAPAGGALPPEMEAKHAKLQTDFAAMETKVEALTTRNQALEREGRVERYTKLATGWLTIPGKPGDLAVKLADIEEKAGKEVADSVVAQYQAANKAAVEAGLLKPVGRSRTGEGASPAEAQIKAYEASGVTGAKAVAKLAREHPALFRAYQIDNLDGGNNDGK